MAASPMALAATTRPRRSWAEAAAKIKSVARSELIIRRREKGFYFMYTSQSDAFISRL
jgi:hypothetical protein